MLPIGYIETSCASTPHNFEKQGALQSSPAFCIRCDAGLSGALRASSERLSAAIGQTISRDGAEQIWDFLFVLSKRDSEGVLSTRVLLCHPDWDEPLEIALIESNGKTLKVVLRQEESRPP